MSLGSRLPRWSDGATPASDNNSRVCRARFVAARGALSARRAVAGSPWSRCELAVLGHRALDLVVGDDGAVVVVEDGEEPFAADMDEEMISAVEMERRGRIRRGHEQEPLDLFEVGVEQAVEAARAGHRQQRVFQKP